MSNASVRAIQAINSQTKKPSSVNCVLTSAAVERTKPCPRLVLPAGLTRGGLPVGVEFDAPAGADRDLLALGLTLQRVLGPIPAPKRARGGT